MFPTTSLSAEPMEGRGRRRNLKMAKYSDIPVEIINDSSASDSEWITDWDSLNEWRVMKPEAPLEMGHAFICSVWWLLFLWPFFVEGILAVVTWSAMKISLPLQTYCTCDNDFSLINLLTSICHIDWYITWPHIAYSFQNNTTLFFIVMVYYLFTLCMIIL